MKSWTSRALGSWAWSHLACPVRVSSHAHNRLQHASRTIRRRRDGLDAAARTADAVLILAEQTEHSVLHTPFHTQNVKRCLPQHFQRPSRPALCRLSASVLQALSISSTSRAFHTQHFKRISRPALHGAARSAASASYPLEALLDLPSRQSEHHRPAVRADRRVRGAAQFVEQVLHLLARERIVRLDGGVARHRCGHPSQ